MGWLSTIVKVANTATGFYLNNFAVAEGDESTDNTDRAVTKIGDLAFINNLTEKKTLIKNEHDKDYFVYFSTAQDDGNVMGEYILIHGGKEFDATQLMKRYKDGQITCTPSEGTEKDSSIIAFSVEYLVKDKTSLGKEHSYELSMSNDDKQNKQFIFSSNQKFDSFEMSFTDRNGLSYSVKDEHIDNVQNLYIARAKLPSGCSHLYPYKDLRINITLSGEALSNFKQLLASKV